MSQPPATGPLATSSGAPAVLGLSHLGLSVPDLDAARGFWIGVLNFELTTREESLCFVVDRTSRLSIGLTTNGGTVDGEFDERRTGLDHLAIAVPDVAAIHSWAQWLDEHAVPHSPVTETFAGHHLNLRAPATSRSSCS